LFPWDSDAMRTFEVEVEAFGELADRSLVVAAAQRREVRELFVRRQAFVQAELAGQVAHAPMDRDSVATGVESEDGRPAAGRADEVG
jgi:hypothetical protein